MVVKAVVGAHEEDLVFVDGSVERNAIFNLVLLGLYGMPYGGVDGGGRVKTPAVEIGIAEDVEDGAVPGVGAGLDYIILKAYALVLCRGIVGDDLELVDGLDRDSVGDVGGGRPARMLVC